MSVPPLSARPFRAPPPRVRGADRAGRAAHRHRPRVGRGPTPSSTRSGSIPGRPTSSGTGSASSAPAPPGCSAVSSAGLEDTPSGYAPPRLRHRSGPRSRHAHGSPLAVHALAQPAVPVPAGAGWQGDDLEVRRKIPPLSQPQVARLAEALQASHRAWQEHELCTPTAEQRSNRARRLALSLLELGEDLESTRALAAPLEVPPRPRPSAAAVGLGAPPPGRRGRRPDASSRSHPRLTAAAAALAPGRVRATPSRQPCPERQPRNRRLIRSSGGLELAQLQARRASSTMP